MHPELYAALKDGATLVTANSRTARAMRHEFGRERRAEDSRAWQTPVILSWGAWIDRLWEDSEDLPATLNAIQEDSLWRQAVESSGGGLIHFHGAATTARKAWYLLHKYRVPVSSPHWEASPDSIAFRRWAEEYDHRTRSLRRTDRARLPDQVAPPARKRLYLAGFDEFTPQQEDVFGKIEGVTRIETRGRRARNAVLMPLPDLESELFAAAEWARDRMDKTVGIAVPDLDAIRPRLERIFCGVIPGAFHLSRGLPLAGQPMAAAALHMIEMALHPVPMDAATRVLLSPFAAGGLGARALRDVELRKRGRWEVSLAAVQVFPDAATLAAQFPESQPPSRWAHSFSALLKAFGWPGANADPAGVEDWRSMLGEFASLDQTVGAIAGPGALAWLRRCAAAHGRESEDLGQPVRIVETPEAAGSEFDALWITGMDSDSWPPEASPNPFLPLVLQRALRVPNSSPEQVLSFARRVTEKLLESADEIVVSYAESEGDRVRRASPLVADLKKRSSRGRTEVRLETKVCPTLIFEDPTGPPLRTKHQAGGARVLELQAACPFRAFAEFRLRATPLDAPEQGLEPRERGILIHTALEHLWRAIGGSRGLADSPESAVPAAVAAALDRLSDASPFDVRVRELERRRLTTLLTNWIDHERTRLIAFDVIAEEEKRDVDIGGLRLETRIDRVDRLPGCGDVLIDYKLTAPSPAGWDGDRPDSPQLPLYAVSHEEPLAAAVFAQVRTGDLRFRGMTSVRGALPGAEEVGLEDFTSRVKSWGEALEKLAREFRDGVAKVDPKNGPETCQYCHLASLCRVSDP